MTTTPTVKGKAAAAQTSAAKAAPAPSAENAIKPINRREFLYYIWGASVALLTAGSGGLLIWFALPRFREGEFGGVFPIEAGTIPAAGAPPKRIDAGRFWLSHTDKGVVAISTVCTHLGCLYAWVTTYRRFECPCHGSKFTAEGQYIEGPAPRNLDVFAVQVVTPSGTTVHGDGEPADVNGATEIRVDTGRKIKGKTHG